MVESVTEATAFVLLENGDQIVIDRFTMQQDSHFGVEEVTVLATEEARARAGRGRVWMIGVAGGSYALKSDAFETAWLSRIMDMQDAA